MRVLTKVVGKAAFQSPPRRQGAEEEEREIGPYLASWRPGGSFFEPVNGHSTTLPPGMFTGKQSEPWRIGRHGSGMTGEFG
jgi:hypothetical protein